MNKTEQIEKLLSEGKTPKEIVAMGFNSSVVYTVATKDKGKTTKGECEKKLGKLDNILEVARDIDLLTDIMKGLQ